MSEVEPVPRIGRGRCGCASTDCTCIVFGSGTISVIGTGSETDPLKFIADSEMHVSVVDTEVDLTLTGSGTPADPYILSGTIETTTSTTTSYITPGTFSLMVDTGKTIAVTCVGGGGGGGGGQVDANGLGGAGGQGGAFSQLLADLPPEPSGWELEITVGAGGSGQGPHLTGRGGDGGLSRVRRRPQAGGAWEILLLAGGGYGGNGGRSGGTDHNPGQEGALVGGRGGWSVTGSPVTSTGLSPAGGGGGRSIGTNSRAAENGGSALARDAVGGASGGGIGDPLGGGGGGATGGAGAAATRGGGGGGGGAASVAPAGSGGSGGNGLVKIVVW